MNKPLTLTAILVMGASLALAQAGGSKDPKAPKNSKVALNPQPEPPGVQKKSPAPKAKPQPKAPENSKLATGSGKVSLNPQPLPPGERKAGGDPTGAEKVSLNPQPLPPGERKAGGDPNSTKQTKTTKKGPANANAPAPK